MENTTMTKGIAPMSTSRTRIRIERSLSARFLAPVQGEAWGTTLSAGAHDPITTLTTPFMDVDDLRSGRPPV